MERGCPFTTSLFRRPAAVLRTYSDPSVITTTPYSQNTVGDPSQTSSVVLEKFGSLPLVHGFARRNPDAFLGNLQCWGLHPIISAVTRRGSRIMNAELPITSYARSALRSPSGIEYPSLSGQRSPGCANPSVPR
jgi:hypothetical protein